MTDSLIHPASLLTDAETSFTPAEGQLLRSLAGQVAELAARPVEQAKRRLWLEHNALRPTRPLVFCDPEIGWNEIIPPGALASASPLARDWEFRLRRELFWGQAMKDDRVIQPVFDVAHVHAEPDWGLREVLHDTSGADRTAYVWDAPVQGEADWERVHAPILRVDFGATDRLVEQAAGLFGDLLPVRLKTQWWWTLGMTQTLIKLRGMTAFLLDLAENPAFVQRMMATLRDGSLAMLAALEEAGLLGMNWDGSYVGSGGFGWSEELPGPGYDGQARLRDLWGFAESQETVGVSPRMFEQLIFPYQLPLLEKFGLNCYGCCEPLDQRWQVVRRIPRLRRVSVSPWSDRRKMAEALGERYILSYKPNPAVMAAGSFDEEGIRAGLREDLTVTRGCRVEVIMKDVTTLLHDPRRVTRWVEMALEEAEEVGG